MCTCVRPHHIFGGTSRSHRYWLVGVQEWGSGETCVGSRGKETGLGPGGELPQNVVSPSQTAEEARFEWHSLSCYGVQPHP